MQVNFIFITDESFIKLNLKFELDCEKTSF